jgi:DNA-binding response OmpR family regulator
MRPPRVLIVDDDQSFRTALFRYSHEAGLECQSAADGREALRLCRQNSPDAVILDLILPGGVNGFDVLWELRSDPRTAAIRVLLITGTSRAEILKSAGKGYGVSAFFHKPCDFADIVSAVYGALAEKIPRDPNLIVCGPLLIDLKRRDAFARGTPMELGPVRFDVLRHLAQSKDGLTEEMLKAFVWSGQDVSANIVAVTVNRLRADLERACGQDMIGNIPGGYKLLY